MSDYKDSRLNVLDQLAKKQSSYFCFRRKSLYQQTEVCIAELDDRIDKCATELLGVQQDLDTVKASEARLEADLKERQGEVDALSLENAELTSKSQLVSSLLSAKPLHNEGLREFKEILYGDFLDFANEESALAEEAKAILLLQDIEQRMEEVALHPGLYKKNVVAIGGGFSSGKSTFASGFFENLELQLPIGIEPVTAIPTYIIPDSESHIFGFSRSGGRVPIDVQMYKKMSHDYVKSFSFNLRDIMPSMVVGTPFIDEKFKHIALVDTPGYNPAESEGYTDKDKAVASKHLKTANALIWVVGVDSYGTIPRSDLMFLESLDLSEKELYVVANKADLKAQSELDEILDGMQEMLEDYDVPFKGISAYSVINQTEYSFRGMPLGEFLASQNKSVPSRTKLTEQLTVVFQMYLDAFEDVVKNESFMNKQLHSLGLDILSLGLDEDESEEEKVLERIEQLKKSFANSEMARLVETAKALKIRMNSSIVNMFGEL